MKSKVRRDKNRLNLKSVKEGSIIFGDGEGYFSRTDIGKYRYRLLKQLDKIISYIPDCEDETDEVDDMNCHVMGYQKWVVFDFEFNIERKIEVHFFIAKWKTILNNQTLYNKITYGYDFVSDSDDDYFDDEDDSDEDVSFID